MYNISFWSFLFIVSLPVLTLWGVDIYLFAKRWYDENKY
jgi:hypothetical protein